ncbi:MAG: hypothetical protein ACFE89_06085 [Candidatus Hodarchaeota archaeon]
MSWSGLSTQQFSFLIFVFAISLMLVTVFAVLTNTLWTIGMATPWLLHMPVWYYLETHLKHKKIAQFIWQFLFAATMSALFHYFGPQWTPSPQFPLAIIQHVAALSIFIFLTTALCERYRKLTPEPSNPLAE